MIEPVPVPATDPALRAALAESLLPIEDLDDPGRAFFVFTQAGRPVAFAGLEPHGEDALLRSVVVLSEARGRGLGRAVVEAMTARARAHGARRLWLLTDTAEPFFLRLGFTPADRASAPAAILATRQAAALCRTAPLLSLSLLP